MARIDLYRRCAASCAAMGVSAALCAWTASAQPAPPPNGPKQVDPSWHALVGATVVPEPGRTLDDATIVLRNGLIVSVEEGGEPPRGARVWDCSGLTVYPGLIDPYVPVAAPEPDENEEGRHWNRSVVAERSVLDGEGVPEAKRESLRAMGFTVAGIAPEEGIFRGTTGVVSLGEDDVPGRAEPVVLREDVFDAVAFETSGWRSRAYPGSKMGAIALIRQTFLDSAWYEQALSNHEARPSQNPRPARNDSFAALALGRPMLFVADNELDVLRGARIAEEFNRRIVVKGGGDEYQRLDAILSLGAPLIVPPTMAAKPKVETPGDRESVSLRELMAWEQSPTTLRRLDEGGARVSLTSSGLRTKTDKEDFYENLRRAIEHGLDEDRALAMLTTHPAELLGLGDRIGRIEPGMIANLVVTEGRLFEEKRKVRDVWIDGRRYEVTAPEDKSYAGEWDVLGGMGTLTIGEDNSVKYTRSDPEAEGGEREFKGTSVNVSENRLSWVMDADVVEYEGEGVALVWATVEDDEMFGRIETPDGSVVAWNATRVPEEIGEDPDDTSDEIGEKDEDTPPDVPEELAYPLGAFGLERLPEQRDLVVTNATIWTCGPEGIIRDGTLVVRDGKIAGVYEGDAPSGVVPGGALLIDAEGGHVTPGLIDCHSHTGISGGVNEGTQAVTAEVRIADVINPDDVDWYRQLAGGLTCANQLHGSANPIGGQNSVVKLRWGTPHPDGMRFEGASPGIKFALGENVKQSNWGDDFTTRYPQTRMGVESIMRDRFVAAREYMKERGWGLDASGEKWIRVSSPSETQRRDLELEALAEIIRGERLVHCHSYRQDEILMLCRVAEEFGFTIGTFQHVLEGYKVAEAIREHALGGSSFSDWWAYKFEVYDAIPYNGAIMHDAGVVVSFNSDSDELARRMNVEAAKAVKYGGVPPEEALKFVTLNPAIQLRIDDRVGSLEEGKDADFVIWSGDPLSTMSRCEATYIDGRRMFSLEKDRELRELASRERRRIIQKLLDTDDDAKKPDDDAATADPAIEEKEMIDSPPDGARAPLRLRMLEQQYEYMILNGMNPFEMRCGDCGCSTHNLFLLEAN